MESRESIERRIESAAAYIRGQTALAPAMGLVLGSGLGDFCDGLEDAVSFSAADIPGFPVPSAQGHAGALVFGVCRGKTVAALRGRAHYYEGFSMRELTVPVRVLRRLGVQTLMLTNAAGGINPGFSAGALMLISDHINYSGQNPLIGENLDSFGPRFPDMSDVYTAALRGQLKNRAAATGISLQEGVYAMYSGPNYETPAEIRMFRALGADAVGMSTVPEALAARHAGMRVIGVSCITNMAAGILPGPLSHAEVLETARRVKDDFLKVLHIAIELCG